MASAASLFLVLTGSAAVQIATSPEAVAAGENGYVFNDQWTLVSPGSASGPRTPSAFKSQAATKATTKIPLSTGTVDVTAQFSAGPEQLPGANFLANGTNQASYGAAANMLTGSPDPAKLPALGVLTTASSCGGPVGTAAHQNFDGVCENTGKLTLKFSKPVTNPVLDITGLGGQSNVERDINGVFWARGSFDATHWTIQTPGVSFAELSGGRTNLKTDGKTLEVAADNSHNMCNERPQGHAGTDYRTPKTDFAGCGSATLLGTFSEVTFKLDTEVRRFSNFPAATYDTGSLYFKDRKDGQADGINGLNVVPGESPLVPEYEAEATTSDLHRVSLRLPETNRLGDFVWEDTNGNGLQDSGEPGVAGVKAELLDCTGKPADGDGNGKPDTAVTDAKGKYSFDGLRDGCYQVRFTAPNGKTFTKPRAGDTTKDSDADPKTGTTGQTTLGADKREDLTLDAGLVAKTGNRLGDFVWEDTNGNGLQDTGEPGVAGVKAELLDCTGKPADGDGNGKPDTTVTDAQGKYHFDGLRDGCYQVHFTAPDGKTFTKPNIGDNAKNSDAEPKTGTTGQTTLGADKREDLTLDAGLVAKPGNHLGDFVWEDTNGNGLQDSGEPGVPGVKVELLDCTGKPADGDGNGKPDTAVTDAKGKYSFDGLRDGCYQVHFTAPDGKIFTKPHAGDNTKDSDADPKTGTTGQTTLGRDKPTDLTVDAGLVPQSGAPGLIDKASESGPLAFTGVDIAWMAGAAVLLLGGGGAALLYVRRRRSTVTDEG
ncbi:SdrD B-like protein [Amycolatopsis sulphurea]|uniref:SdrD B-like protein n=1 Tax=Amycolatopsis sulphurea TaxID=76022 RepID=A0A2A9F5L6_9PSEU|nr:SdrD B-like domain-containing protein [Amycolatopsis sulphurea]PFG46687.1 SdrD B-like protein [Amycolatopsis sulphurea]